MSSKRRMIRNQNMFNEDFVEDTFRDMLSDNALHIERELSKVSEITGLNFDKGITFEEIMSYYRDNGKSNQEVFDYFLQSIYDIQEKLNKLEFNVKQDFYTHNIRSIVINILSNSLLYLCTVSCFDMNEIHLKLFGNALKGLSDEVEEVDLSKSVVHNYAKNVSALNIFVSKGVINSPFAGSIANNIFNLNELYDLKKLNEEIDIKEVVDLNNLRKLLKHLAPKSYKTVHTFIKNKSSYSRVLENGLISVMPKSIISSLYEEFQTDNTFRTYVHLFSLTAILEYKDDDLIKLFNSPNVIRDIHLNLNLNTAVDSDLFSLAEDTESRDSSNFRILLNRIVSKILENDKHQGLVSIEKIIANYFVDETSRDHKEVEFTHNSLLTVMTDCQVTINNFSKNKRGTIKKLCDGDGIAPETAKGIIEQTAEKLMSQCQLIRIAESDSKYVKSIRLREAFKIVNASLPTSTEISLNHVDVKSVRDVMTLAPQLIKYVKKYDIIDEFIFIIMAMLNTSIAEYTFVNSDVVSNNTIGKILDKSSLTEEHNKLKEEVLGLKSQLSTYQEQLESSSLVVHKEVDRITKQLRADNSRLERELFSEREGKKELENKISDYQSQLDEANKIIIEMIEETDSKDETDITEMIDYLKTKRVSFLGGYPTLINHLKSYIPNINIIYKEGPSINVKSLENNDINIVYSQNLSHGFSYSMKSKTSFGDNFLIIEKRIGAKQVIKRAYDHLLNGPKAYKATENIN